MGGQICIAGVLLAAVSMPDAAVMAVLLQDDQGG